MTQFALGVAIAIVAGLLLRMMLKRKKNPVTGETKASLLGFDGPPIQTLFGE